MKTSYMFLLLLGASWGLEILFGLQCIMIYWNYPLPGGNFASMVTHVGNVFLNYAQSYPVVPHASRTYWTPDSVTHAFIVFYFWLHLIWAGGSLLWPKYGRLKLGARRPSPREQQQLETALASLTRARPSIACPRLWLVTDGPGLRMHWVGYVLVVDRALLQHHHLRALLAHELGHVNQEDRMARRLFAMLPTNRALIFALVGLPVGISTFLLYPVWVGYWRARIYAADRYAVGIGQGHALSKALNDLYLPLDRVTPFGRWFRPVPYVEARIGRIGQVTAKVVSSTIA